MSDDLDKITGQVFATVEGREWLRLFGNRSAAYRTVCRDIEARVKRRRVEWGDISQPSPSDAPSARS